MLVRFGSWDKKKKRYLSPKGRAGDKHTRKVPLFGLALDAARAWLKVLPSYAPHNPDGLMFPTPMRQKVNVSGGRGHAGGGVKSQARTS